MDGVHRTMIVATNFPPDASVGTQRTLRLVRHLAESGWQVDVVTGAPERFRSGTVCDPVLLDKVPADVHVVRPRAWRPFERLVAALRALTGRGTAAQTATAPTTSAPPTAAGGTSRPALVGRVGSALMTLPDREVSWILPAVAAGWRRARQARPDVIYSSGPPFSAHFVAAALARVTRRPWVADFRDPWARAPWREDRFAFERRAWDVLERAIVTRADAVLFVTDTNRQDFARHYGDAVAARFHVVANGCDTADFDGLVRREPVDGRFVLLHAGSLYGARNPAPILRALAQAIAAGSIRRSQVCLRFIGRVGVPGASLPALVQELAIQDVVQFVEHMPRRRVLQEMINASALLIVQPVTTVSIPAKLYEYMAAGRPVLALAEPGGETARLVHACHAGVAVRADDEDAIGRALVALVASAPRFVPVHRSCFDGAQRAREIRQVLSDLAARQTNAVGGVAMTTPAATSEVRRS